MKHINHKGFSLLEILLTITLLSILFAILVTTVRPRNIIFISEDNRKEADALTIYQALEQYALKNNTYPESIKNMPNNSSAYICKTSAPSCNKANQINLSTILVPTYLSKIPEYSKDTNNSGFYVVKDSNGKIGIGGIRRLNDTTFVKGIEKQNFESIVTDGLVVYLDTGYKNSYPGTGNTWFDLSGNGYNGTAGNISIANDPIAKNVLNYNASTAITVNLSPPVNHEAWSVIFWIKSTGLTTSNYRNIVAIKDTNSLHSYFYNFDTRETTNSYVLGYQKDYSLNNWLTTPFNNSSEWANNTWWCIGVSHNNTIFKSYKQGQLFSTQNQNLNVANYGDINQIFINRSNGNTVYMGSFYFYNRILTDAEFTQTFNATKGRFGL
jgi:prepilin-type N-terminal cleavage/methylation domain-containing protein